MKYHKFIKKSIVIIVKLKSTLCIELTIPVYLQVFLATKWRSPDERLPAPGPVQAGLCGWVGGPAGRGSELTAQNCTGLDTQRHRHT